MPFQKGQIANPLGAGARQKKRPITEKYHQLLVNNPEKLEKFCMAQIDNAIAGDTVAAKDIIDRLEGKPLQSIDVNDTRRLDNSARLTEILASITEAARASEDGSGTVQ